MDPILVIHKFKKYARALEHYNFPFAQSKIGLSSETLVNFAKKGPHLTIIHWRRRNQWCQLCSFDCQNWWNHLATQLRHKNGAKVGNTEGTAHAHEKVIRISPLAPTAKNGCSTIFYQKCSSPKSFASEAAANFIIHTHGYQKHQNGNV